MKSIDIKCNYFVVGMTRLDECHRRSPGMACSTFQHAEIRQVQGGAKKIMLLQFEKRDAATTCVTGPIP